MRKKSHVALARYLVRGLGSPELARHRKAFCLGSILPDLNPKMLAAPHEYDTTFESFCLLCRQTLDEAARTGEENERVLWRRTGVATHYLADYFTYPHNASFEGSVKDHCMYESELKYRMRVLVWMPEGREIFARARETAEEIGSIEELFGYITRMHKRYMRARTHSPESDCRLILELCAAAMIVFAELIDTKRQRGTGELCA